MERSSLDSSHTVSDPIESRFAVFLENNDCPPQPIATELKGMLSKPVQNLRYKDDEVDDLELTLEAFEAELKVLQTSISEYGLIQAPIRRLPPDILGEIFYHCLPTHRNPVMSYKEAPLLLTCISKSWQSIALSSPRLWTRVHIPLYIPKNPNPGPWGHSPSNWWDGTALEYPLEDSLKMLRDRQKIVKAWLSRSRSCPLTISLWYPGAESLYEAGESLPENPLSQIVDTVLSFSSNIEEFELSVPLHFYQTLFPDIASDQFPILKRVKICITGREASNSTSGNLISLIRAQHLQSLSIAPPTLIFDPSGDALSTDHLNNLSIHLSITGAAAVKILRQCRRLKHCKLTISNHPDEPLDHHDGILSLPDLLTLALAVDIVTDPLIKDLYNRIYAPRLTRFEFRKFIDYSNELVDPATPRPPTGVCHLLEKANSLTRLSIDVGFVSADDVLFCFRSSSQITHLEIASSRRIDWRNAYDFWDTDLRDFDIRTLTLPHDSEIDGTQNEFGASSSASSGKFTEIRETLLPKLEVFKGHMAARKTTDNQLKDFILSRVGAAARWNCVSSLKRVKLIIGRARQIDIEADIRDVIQKAGSEDFQLDLKYNYSPVMDSYYQPYPNFFNNGPGSWDSWDDR